MELMEACQDLKDYAEYVEQSGNWAKLLKIWWRKSPGDWQDNSNYKQYRTGEKWYRKKTNEQVPESITETRQGQTSGDELKESQSSEEKIGRG